MKRIVLLIVFLQLYFSSHIFAYDFTVNNVYYNIIPGTQQAEVTFGESYDSYSGSVVIPQTVTHSGTNYSVTAIGEFAFATCSNLTDISIAETVTQIGYGAFKECVMLTSVRIPAYVREIGDYAFSVMSRMTSFEVDANNEYFSSLDGVLYNKDKTHLINYPLNKSGNKFEIPTSVISIGKEAFRECTTVNSVVFPPSLLRIENNAFHDCDNLESVIFPQGIQEVQEYAFASCGNLGTLSIPNTLSSIETGTFWGCTQLKSVEIPENITFIGESAFRDCTEMTYLSIPSSVNKIENYAFWNCLAIRDVYVYWYAPLFIPEHTFYYEGLFRCTLHVPSPMLFIYANSSTNWRRFTNIVEFNPSGIENITQAISIYPNPITEGFYISGIDGDSEITLWDMAGKMVFSIRIDKDTYINISHLPKGIYIIKAVRGKQLLRQEKIIKN